jgi:hypothetical protein
MIEVSVGDLLKIHDFGGQGKPLNKKIQSVA